MKFPRGQSYWSNTVGALRLHRLPVRWCALENKFAFNNFAGIPAAIYESKYDAVFSGLQRRETNLAHYQFGREGRVEIGTSQAGLPGPSRAPVAQRSQNGCHECTENTKRSLEQVTPNMRGALAAKGDGAASVIVAPETVTRALALLDDLMRAVEQLGHSISTRNFPATLVVNGEHVSVAISEEFERNDEEPDPAEETRRKSYELKYPGFVRDMDFRNAWVYRPTGQLMISLGDGGGGRSLRRLWADTASHRVESRVDEVANAAIGHAQVQSSRREKIEQRTAERRETEVLHRLEEKRIAFLDEYADTLEKADKLQRFLQNVRRRGNGHQSKEMLAFLKWADSHVASLREDCSAPAVDQDVTESELWSQATTDTE